MRTQGLKPGATAGMRGAGTMVSAIMIQLLLGLPLLSPSLTLTAHVVEVLHVDRGQDICTEQQAQDGALVSMSFLRLFCDADFLHYPLTFSFYLQEL
jgi:sorbitol-specific phosphotransferase system component IIBC